MEEEISLARHGSFLKFDRRQCFFFITYMKIAKITTGNIAMSKGLEMACDQIQTCLIFPLRWACFPIKVGRNAQWVHLFIMDFNEFSIIYLIF